MGFLSRFLLSLLLTFFQNLKFLSIPTLFLALTSITTQTNTMFDSNEFKKYATKHQGINSMHMEHYIESSLTPYIIEERQLNMTQMDVFSRLMMDRIIFLGTGINDQVANIINAQLLFLESVGVWRNGNTVIPSRQLLSVAREKMSLAFCRSTCRHRVESGQGAECEQTWRWRGHFHAKRFVSYGHSIHVDEVAPRADLARRRRRGVCAHAPPFI